MSSSGNNGGDDRDDRYIPLDEVERMKIVDLESRRRKNKEGRQTKIDELAKLAPIDYDRARKTAAKELECGVTALDKEVAKARPNKTNGSAGHEVQLHEPEPWPDPVDGAALLDEIAANITRHVVLDDVAAVALWVVHAFCPEVSQITPRLAVLSPTKGCGKTTLLDVLEQSTARSLPVSNVTAAALFRFVEKYRPVLLIDEGDSFVNNNDELRGVLNAGHKWNGKVIRCVGDDNEPRAFHVFAPIALAMIGLPPPTIMDRSIVIAMRRRAAAERVERFRADRVEHLTSAARRAARWAEDNKEQLRRCDPDIPTSLLSDRAADNWRPLLAIADLAGGNWPERARRCAIQMAGGYDEQSAREMLLADIKTLFERLNVDALPSQQLVDELVKLEERPWPEWRRGKPLTTRQLASLLRSFHVVPGNIRIGDKVPKGYRRDQFEDAFARYIPATPDSAATPLQAAVFLGFWPFLSATSGSNVADEKRDFPRVSAGCSGVAAENPPLGEECLSVADDEPDRNSTAYDPWRDDIDV